MAGPISFKLGTRLTCYVIHMHVHLFCDTIQYGRQAAILFQFLHVQSQYLNMTGPIFLKLGTRTRHYGVHMHVNLLNCDTIQCGCQAAILFQFLHVLS